MKLIIKGFIIGIGKIMPGVSGAMLAISLGVYEKAIYAISHFFDNPIKYIKYLLPLAVGVILSLVLTSNLIMYFMTKYYLITMLFFIGLIVSGTYHFIPKLSITTAHLYHYFIMFISFLTIILLQYNHVQLFLNIGKSKFILIGIIDAVTMIVPGLCGTAIMMLLGCYDVFLGIMTKFNFGLVIYGLSALITILLLSRIISYLIIKKQQTIYFAIFGFSLSSILVLIISIMGNYSVWEIFIAILFFILGLFLGNIFDR